MRILIGCLLWVAPLAWAEDMPTVFRPSEIKWEPGPPSLLPGAQMAKLEGDSAKDGPYTVRFKFPDGFRVMPHWHPKTERVTVIAGTLHLGMGEKFDKDATQSLPAGTHGYWPAGMRHFAWVEGETVLQLHGIGPWAITYVNPADDPRHK